MTVSSAPYRAATRDTRVGPIRNTPALQRANLCSVQGRHIYLSVVFGHVDGPRPEEPGFGRVAFCRDDQGVLFGSTSRPLPDLQSAGLLPVYPDW